MTPPPGQMALLRPLSRAEAAPVLAKCARDGAGFLTLSVEGGRARGRVLAYQPPEGWVQVTRNAATGEVYSQRFHGDRACAEQAVAARLAKARQKGTSVESYLSDKMTYAQAHRLTKFSACKSAPGKVAGATPSTSGGPTARSSKARPAPVAAANHGRATSESHLATAVHSNL